MGAIHTFRWHLQQGLEYCLKIHQKHHAVSILRRQKRTNRCRCHLQTRLHRLSELKYLWSIPFERIFPVKIDDYGLDSNKFMAKKTINEERIIFFITLDNWFEKVIYVFFLTLPSPQDKIINTLNGKYGRKIWLSYNWIRTCRLSFALKVADKGKVAIVTKAGLSDTNTVMPREVWQLSRMNR